MFMCVHHCSGVEDFHWCLSPCDREHSRSFATRGHSILRADLLVSQAELTWIGYFRHSAFHVLLFVSWCKWRKSRWNPIWVIRVFRSWLSCRAVIMIVKPVRNCNWNHLRMWAESDLEKSPFMWFPAVQNTQNTSQIQSGYANIGFSLSLSHSHTHTQSFSLLLWHTLTHTHSSGRMFCSENVSQ